LAVKIITGDRDLLQLVDSRVIVSLPGKRLSDASDYTEETVVETMGVRPDQVVDYKALCGDKSDNIPGVYGIGKKSAETLLGKYDTLEGIYAHLEELPAGQRNKLDQGRENAYLSQKLARIVTDLEVPIDLEKASVTNFEPSAVAELFRELEFRSLMGRLQTVMEQLGMIEPPSAGVVSGQQMSMFPTAVGGNLPDTKLESVIVDQEETLREMVAEITSAEMIAFDTETTGTDKMQADLVGISIAVQPGKGYYIPVGHAQGRQLPIEQVMAALHGPLTDKQIPKAGHNLKYDFVMLARYGLEVFPLSFDTMIAEWLRDPSSRNLGLKNLSWVRLGVQMIEIEELIGKGKNQITMAEVPIEQAGVYAVADAESVLRLVPGLKEDLQNVSGMQLYNEMEMPLVAVLSGMEMNGVGLDVEFLGQMSEELEVRMTELEQEVFQQVGMTFNLNSTQQLSEALFDKLGIILPLLGCWMPCAPKARSWKR
jgi:DNA polymerase-1